MGMNEKDILQLAIDLKSGVISENDFVTQIKRLGAEEVSDYACLDHSRELRTGFPEVIFAKGKSVEQFVEIFLRLVQNSDVILATRVSESQINSLLKRVKGSDVEGKVVYNSAAKTALFRRENVQLEPSNTDTPPYIAILSAGTSDFSVAEEAAVTAEAVGYRVDRINDVGVAGLHRLLSRMERISSAKVIIVVAGMEGALASVVGGLVSVPVIAVPTSVGYGANFGGLSALLSMLNSCASGVTVTNIDNGFGAGYTAALMLKNFVK